MKNRTIPHPLSLTRKRITAMMLAFLLFLSYLLFNLFKLQIYSQQYYKDKVFDQITTTAKLSGERGNIYDRNMTVLAASKSVWRVFAFAREIKKAQKERGIDYIEIISTGLSNILDMEKTEISEKLKRTDTLDLTIKNNISKEQHDQITDFVIEKRLEGLIFMELQSSRFYPEGTLLAHTLGFTGSDNQGLYGLEYYYDSYLKGTDGYYLYAKDANGNSLDTGYSSYTNPTNGSSLVTTIDSFVQRALENQLYLAARNAMAQNRATGIVMDNSTGAILAIATTSPFNPNDPYTLDELYQKKLLASGFVQGSEEYTSYKRQLMTEMWSNKAISEAYEPGSTFKIITVSSALDASAVKTTDRFSCIGYHTIGGYRIRCHKTTGHGSGFTLAYGLQMSCNPTMISVSERLGAEKFYKYIESFGYFKKSGIDLPGEATTIFHSPNAIGPTELATISFGQRFKVTLINHLKAIASVANGGFSITPYIVEKIISEDGSLIYEHEPQKGEKIISKETADAISQILEEGVSTDGGAKNAAVKGYKIAAKTGTSQKFDVLDENGNSYLRTSSTVAYNLSDDGGISVIIVVDEPMCQVKYGSVVAAPYVSSLLSEILPYLGYRSSAEETEIRIPNLIGKTVSEAKSALDTEKLSFEIVGNGDKIISQTPTYTDTITSENTKIILYTTSEPSQVTVPSVCGIELSEAVEILIELGLNVEISAGSKGGTVVYQSLPLGATVERGKIIKIKALVLDYED